ncbi:flagellar hook-associated protein FlgL [Desulfohalobiaceae bacterium Ax17]|uniref:flagellar hook-associated protein FlgL n=1 Tax=Desulfovulcanus ferrireducens TaxID=2831190 RepID=UPI00207BB3C1|nr:flagellar hook-associated protein FlgL [Desulfovulcanus ferrireducens]MBT8763791.1 flagellar hook-associated protein FlgL [Desulfovulcanus ferrireducens]
MRVTQSSLYSSIINQLGSSTSKLMELNNQMASQKKIDRPSDDPVGASRILYLRDSLGALGQYRENVDTAKGWLTLADETLLQVNNVLTRFKELAEQAATGTLTDKDREIVSYEARQLFDQMINLANTTYEGKSIFAGHKVDSNAYEKGMMVYAQDGNVEPYLQEISGYSDHSILVQFVGASNSQATVGTDNINYRFSRDGGKTWSSNKTITAAGPYELDLDGVTVKLREGYQVDLSPETNLDTSKGTWLYVTSTAIYNGDDETQAAVKFGSTGSPENFNAVLKGAFDKDVRVEIVSGDLSIPTDVTYRYSYDGGTTWIPGDTTTFTAASTTVGQTIIDLPDGQVVLNGTGDASGVTFDVLTNSIAVQQRVNGGEINAYAQGEIDSDIMVRIDYGLDSGGNKVETSFVLGDTTTVSSVVYSYSTDGGRSWTQGTTANTAEADLLIPGGHLYLSAKGTQDQIKAGDQFVVHPKTASLDVEISPSDTIQINEIGWEIFGGHNQYGVKPAFADTEPGKNLFVTLGKFVAAMENNDQDTIAQSLENIETARQHISNRLARVGARENRLDVVDTVLSGLQVNKTERLSKLEDVDVAEVMTDLSQQQFVYEAILKSSAMIMRMSLVKYI